MQNYYIVIRYWNCTYLWHSWKSRYANDSCVITVTIDRNIRLYLDCLRSPVNSILALILRTAPSSVKHCTIVKNVQFSSAKQLDSH